MPDRPGSSEPRPPAMQRPAVGALEAELEESRELVPTRDPRVVAIELVRALCPALPEPVAEVVRALADEGAVGAAVERAETAIAALRHAEPLPLCSSAPLLAARAAECRRCPELSMCGGGERGCAWAWCSRRCASCGVRCPQRADLPSWRAATGSLRLDDLVVRLPEPPALPALVPVLDLEELRDWGVASHWPAWGISLTEVHSGRTGAPWRTWASGTAVGQARAAGAHTLALVGVAPDHLLAAAWPHLARGRTATGFDLVVAPAWSVYDDDPRLEHLFAIRQSLQAAVALARSQPVVPTLHWYRPYDLDRQLRWARGCDAQAVGIDCSTLPGRRHWLEVRAGMAYIRAALPRVQLHVQGPATSERLRDLVRLGGVTVHTRRPAALARARRVLDRDLRDQPGPDEPAECLISVEHMARCLEG
jgi:hypothetical protein